MIFYELLNLFNCKEKLIFIKFHEDFLVIFVEKMNEIST